MPVMPGGNEGLRDLPAVPYLAVPDPGGESYFRLVAVGPPFEDLTGHPPGSLERDPDLWFTLIHPDDRDPALAREREHFATGRPLTSEYRLRATDGRYVWVRDEGVAVPASDGAPRRSRGILVDITRQKAAEARLDMQARVLASVARGEPLAASLDALVALVDAAIDGVHCTIMRVRGDRLWPVAGRGLPAAYAAALAGGIPIAADFGSCGAAAFLRQPVVAADIATDPRWTADAAIRDVAVAGGLAACWSNPILAADGTVLGTFAMYHDVVRVPSPDELALAATAADVAAIAIERAIDHERTLDLEQRLRALIETLPAIVYIDEADDRALTVYVSPQVESILGLRPEAWVADDHLWSRHVHPDDLPGARAGLARVLVTERETTEYRMIAADGRTVWIHDEMALVRPGDGGPPRIHGVMFDVTERVAMEERLRQAGTLDAIGRLAGGIAHDFNNYLTSIIGNVAMALADLEATDPLVPTLRDIHVTADRAARLTRQMLTFGRRGPATPRPVDLGAVVAGVAPMLRRVAGDDIDLDIGIEPDLPIALLDPVQVEQLLVNLVLNARDAMPDGGRVRLIVERLAASSQGPGRVGLLVEDPGAGMDAETLAHAFEPFYSTKDVGHGTGLGLAAAYGIVTAAGGEIWVESTAGAGTSVRVSFPGVDAALEPAAGGSTSVPRARPVDVATILVVEDEPSVRAMVAAVLERHGHRVLVASTGQAAMDLAATADPPVDLLVTDMAMPTMSGPEVAALLRAADPGLPVLFMSGYPDRALREVDPASFDFLQKPFSPDDLARRVASMLAASRRNRESETGRHW